MIFNGIGMVGVALAIALSVGVEEVAWALGLIHPSERLGAGVVLAGFFSAAFGFTVDRSEQRGLLASYAGQISEFFRRPFGPLNVEEARPGRRLAVFGVPLVLMPWFLGIVVTLIAKFGESPAKGVGSETALRLCFACLISGAASLVYGIFTRNLRYVSPEKVEALTQGLLAWVERKRRLAAEPQPASSALAAPISKGKDFLAMVPGLLFLIVGMAVAVGGPEALGYGLVGMGCGILWIFGVLIFTFTRRTWEPCPRCEKAAPYYRRDRGLTLVCPRCSHRWAAGENRDVVG